jgi:hypothetical protein
LEEIINKYTKVLPILSNLEPRYAFLLLQACIHSRPSYLSRLIPPPLAKSSFDIFDSRMSKSLFSILNHGNAHEIIQGLPQNLAHLDSLQELPILGNMVRTLPISMGGIGLRSVSQTSATAFLASALNSLSWIQSNVPTLFEMVSSVFLTASTVDILSSPHLTSVFENRISTADELNDYIQSLNNSPSPSQKVLTHLYVDLPTKSHLLDILRPTPHQRSFYISSMSNTAPTWLKNIKSTFYDFSLSSNELIINLRLLLFIPVITPPSLTHNIKCGCGSILPLNDELYHCFSCQSGRIEDSTSGAHGITFKRHNDICAAFLKLLKVVYPDGNVQSEAVLPANEQGNNQRMDLVVRYGDNEIYFDIVVTNPAGPTNLTLKRSDIYPLAAAKHAFKLKKHRFKVIYPMSGNLAHFNDRLVPLAFETTGAISKESLQYLEQMIAAAKLRPNAGAVNSAYSTFLRRVATIMARSRASHVAFFQAHAIRQLINGQVEVAVALPMFDDDEDNIDIVDNEWGPHLTNETLVI